MTDLDRAIAAARDALDNHDYGHEIPAYVVRNLIAALDAARGQAVAWSRDEYIYDDEGRPIGTDEVQVLWRVTPDPDDGWQPLYAAPPAAPRVERYGEGVLVHWPEGVEQYVAVGDCVTAPSAAACPCGKAECVEPWEPSCGLGTSKEHAVPAPEAPPAAAVPADAATRAEGLHAAIDSASELATNAPDDRYRRRAEQVVRFLRAMLAQHLVVAVPEGTEAGNDVFTLLRECRTAIRQLGWRGNNYNLNHEGRMLAIRFERGDFEAAMRWVKSRTQAPPAAAVPAENVTPMRQPRADLARLVESINAAVYANGDGLSVTEAIGALELAKLELLKEQEQ